MIKRLTKHGNSLALVMDRGVLDLLNIDAETPLNIVTDGHGRAVLDCVPGPGLREEEEVSSRAGRR